MDYYKPIESWATHRGLDKTNPDKQLIKLVEEMGDGVFVKNSDLEDSSC